MILNALLIILATATAIVVFMVLVGIGCMHGDMVDVFFSMFRTMS
jgi:hypothetical protein